MATKRKPSQAKIKRPPVLFGKTQPIIKKLEKRLGHTFMAYWTSRNGSVCHSDVMGMYEILRKFDRKERIYLFVKSDGGSGEASLRMINLLRQFTDQLVAVIPLECASAATMLVLGADEVHMGPLAFLTAVDTSLTHDLSPADIDNDLVSVSQDELARVVRLWREVDGGKGTNPYNGMFPYIHPLVIGAVDRASSLSIKLCRDILSYHMDDDTKTEQISKHLNSAYPSHAYPITLREAQRIGLTAHPLEPDVNELLLELNEIYSEMGQRAVTDYDEKNYHNNEISNIIEGRDVQIRHQIDKDWHYRAEERRWMPMHDQSVWRKMTKVGSKIRTTTFHIR